VCGCGVFFLFVFVGWVGGGFFFFFLAEFLVEEFDLP